MIAVIQFGLHQKAVNLGEIFFIEKPVVFKKSITNNFLIFSGIFLKESKELPLFTKCLIICKTKIIFFGKKVIGLKFKRRKNYRRHFGHRPVFVTLQAVAFVKI